MNKIYKYPLEMTATQIIRMPCGTEILHVAEQHGMLCLWAVVDPAAELRDYVIQIVGNGHPFQRNNKQHLGTVLMGEFVWHVFLVVA